MKRVNWQEIYAQCVALTYVIGILLRKDGQSERQVVDC